MDAGTGNTPHSCVPASFPQFILLKFQFTHKDQIKMWRSRLPADNLDTWMDGEPLTGFILALIQPLRQQTHTWGTINGTCRGFSFKNHSGVFSLKFRSLVPLKWASSSRWECSKLPLCFRESESVGSEMLLDRRWRQRELWMINISNLSYVWKIAWRPNPSSWFPLVSQLFFKLFSWTEELSELWSGVRCSPSRCVVVPQKPELLFTRSWPVHVCAHARAGILGDGENTSAVVYLG